MTAGNPPDDNTWHAASRQLHERICSEFSRKWRSGEQPALETSLGDVEPSQRPRLIARLLEVELRARHANGESPRPEAYRVRFPDQQRLVDDVFRKFGAINDSTAHASLEETQDPASPRHAENVTLTPGERIGRYVIRTILGRGGFGNVYLAFDEELQREVAVKIPNRETFDSPEAVTFFLQEARTVAKLKHPGIVPVYDVGLADDGRPYVVMQYVEGESLKELMESKRLSNDHTARLLGNVAETLAYAHRQGLVHRDLKPANVLLDGESNPLVADFGLAVDETEQRQRAGELAGTLPYMAPEQVRGEVHRLDGRADIWALGVMLYQMLTGRLPFGGDSVQQLTDEILHRQPKPPRQIDDNIPPALERIVSNCCAKQIADRYSAAADLAADLRGYSQTVGTRQTVEQVEQEGPAKSSRPAHRGLKVGLLVGAIAGAAACVLIALGFVFVPKLMTSEVAGQQTVKHRETKVAEKTNGQQGQTASLLRRGPLEGTIDVRVWDQNNDSRNGLSLHEPATRPLKTGDGMRIEARLNKPAYVYILWIDSAGAVLPVYPWRPGDWDGRPADESPVDRVSLPAAADESWPLEGDPGMETLMLLVRESPLPVDVDLKNSLSALPRQAAQDPAALVEFVDGQVITQKRDTERGPKLFDPRRIDDPVLTTQRIIQENLGGHFRYIRAVSFANGGAR